MKSYKRDTLMRDKPRRYLSIFIFVIMVLAATSHCRKSSEEDSLSLEERVRNIIQPHVKVGAMVGILHRGARLIFSFGSKSRNEDVPPDADSVFEIGSITKTFTTTLLADMHVKSLLNLHDSVGDYLPAGQVSLPSYNGIEISFHHLATHFSGLPKLPADIGPLEEYPYINFTIQNMYDFLNSYALTRQPGSQYQYSNIGMGLLGHTLGVIDGTNYEGLLTQKLFLVLDMDRSSVFLTDQQKNNIAHGHDDSLDVSSSWDSLDSLQGSGAIKSCLNDMFNYMEANLGLRDSSLKEAMDLAHQPFTRSSDGGYIGLGWGIWDLPNQKIVWHNGLTAGYTSYMGFNKDLNNGVIILFNHFEAPSWQVGEEILKVLIEY
jgi:CubicO group peptidase (beta-lactamase class C family)